MFIQYYHYFSILELYKISYHKKKIIIVKYKNDKYCDSFCNDTLLCNKSTDIV